MPETWIETKGGAIPKRRTLPQFEKYEEASEWLDSHSTADLEATEVAFEVASPLTIHVNGDFAQIRDILYLKDLNVI